MPKVRGRVLNKLTGEDLYQSCKRAYEGEYMGLDEVEGKWSFKLIPLIVKSNMHLGGQFH